MRVLRIFHGGGVPAYQQRDEEISRLGHEVCLVVPKAFRELPTLTIAMARDDAIRVTPVGLYGMRRNPFFFYNPFRLANILRKFRPQIVDVHEEPYSFASASILLARYISRVRGVMVFRSSQNEFKSYPFPFSTIQRIMFESSAEAYVPSEQARRVLQQKGFAGQISVVGNGVHVPTEKPNGSSVNMKLEVVYVGRLIERKGVQDLLQAVIDSKIDINLTIVGSGPMEPQLRSVVARHDAVDRVKFQGAVTIQEAASIMSRADVICVPSHELKGWSEQFSRALVEGMANFCVPLVSSSGALPEIAGGIVTHFKWGDVEDLTRRLDSLASLSSQELKDLKVLAHEHAVSSYSWQATSSRISKIYERVV